MSAAPTGVPPIVCFHDTQDAVTPRSESAGFPSGSSQVDHTSSRRLALAAQRAAKDRYRSFFENAVEGIFQTTPEGQYLGANPTLARIYKYDDVEDLIAGLRNIEVQLYVKPGRRDDFIQQIQQAGIVTDFESEIRCKDGSVIWIAENARVVRDDEGRVLYYEGTVIDITLRKQVEAKLEELQQQLLTAARRDGMAEIATGVLHNVGNVLNSVNVSASLVAEKVRRSKVAELAQVVQLLDQHAGHLDEFITRHVQGKHLPAFLKLLSVNLEREQQNVLEELSTLVKNIDHIKTIVSMQQSYAGAAGLIEPTDLVELLEDALRMNLPSFERHGIQVERQFLAPLSIPIDKQRLLQILVNLIKNAKDAIKQADARPGRLILRISHQGSEQVRIDVCDNGIGIPPENLTRIFSHGYTTKPEGHGFGLHASANTARQLGGRLTATSAGPDQGATFSVELPLVPPRATV